ncbi:MAG: PhoU domain-containing protein, partial [Oscillospiraceae bacterium]
DAMCETLRTQHIVRLKKGICNIESGIVFLEILTNLERIGDHCSNVAARIVGNEYLDVDFDPHTLRRNMHDGKFSDYNDFNDQYKTKYLQPLLVNDGEN